VTRKTVLLIGAFVAAVAAFDPSGPEAALRVARIALAAVLGGGSIVDLSFAARKFGRG